jgi:DNA repair protein RadC
MKYQEKKLVSKEGKEIIWRHPGGKLRRLGPTSLTDTELLTIILGSGIRGRPAEEIAGEIKKGPTAMRPDKKNSEQMNLF